MSTLILPCFWCLRYTFNPSATHAGISPVLSRQTSALFETKLFAIDSSSYGSKAFCHYAYGAGIASSEGLQSLLPKAALNPSIDSIFAAPTQQVGQDPYVLPQAGHLLNSICPPPSILMLRSPSCDPKSHALIIFMQAMMSDSFVTGSVFDWSVLANSPCDQSSTSKVLRRQ